MSFKVNFLQLYYQDHLCIEMHFFSIFIEDCYRDIPVPVIFKARNPGVHPFDIIQQNHFGGKVFIFNEFNNPFLIHQPVQRNQNHFKLRIITVFFIDFHEVWKFFHTRSTGCRPEIHNKKLIFFLTDSFFKLFIFYGRNRCLLSISKAKTEKQQ